MSTLEDTNAEAGCPVRVYLGDGEHLEQPHSIRFSPLGMQFYSNRNWPQCSLLEFTFDLSEPSDTRCINCSGLVIDCEEEGGSLFRVRVRFMDLPESASERIKRVTQSTELLCPFCENF